MKKWIASVLLCLFVFVGLTSCDEQQNIPPETSTSHVHQWTETDRTPATCSASGSVTYTCTGDGTCDLGGTKTESLPMLPHDVTPDEPVAPTCDSEGKTAGSHCAVCGTVITSQESIPAFGHDFTVEQYDASRHWKACSRCDSIADEAPHRFAVASCDEASRCAECGYEKPAGEHCFGTYTDIIPATCTEKGTAHAACIICGREDVRETPARGHAFTERIASAPYFKTAASCTAAATYYYSCTCGERGSETFSYGDPLPHSFTRQITAEPYLAVSADCTHAATYYYSCTCGERGGETFTYGAPLGHRFTERVTETKYFAAPADCIHAATYYYSCACGECGTATFSVGNLLPHSYTEQIAAEQYIAAPADCRHAATYYYSCTCGACGTETFPFGDVTDHSYTQKVMSDVYFAAPASCTHAATYYYSCTCGACGTETFAFGTAGEHDFTARLAAGQLENLVCSVIKAPTNTESGIGLIYCASCGTYAEAPLPMLPISDYIVVPYIEGAGNECVDSGITMEQSDTVTYDVDMQFVARRANDWGGSNGFLQFCYDYIGHSKRTKLCIEYNKNGDYLEHIFDGGTLIRSLNWSSWTYENTKIGFFSLGNHENGWWKDAAFCQRARLYGATITKNGYVAGCYVPVINAGTGETGLFNIITGSFCGNAGSGGNFILPDGYQSTLEKAPTNTDEGLITVSYPGLKQKIRIPVPAIDPELYRIVPCVEGTGKEYIDTGLHVYYGDSATYSLDYQIMADTYYHFAGSNWFLEFSYDDVNHFYRFLLDIRYNHNGDHKEYIFDNGQCVAAYDRTGCNLECVKIGIFRLGNFDDSWWRTDDLIQQARCYGGQVEINGKLSGYYLPVKNTKTGEAGLYDVISGKFLGNAGSGALALPHDYACVVKKDPTSPSRVIKTYTCRLCGETYTQTEPAAKPLPAGYAALEYIRGTGKQYINTGFTTTTGMIAEYTASFAVGNVGYVVGSRSISDPYGRNGAYLDLARGFWELGFGELFPQNTACERMADKVYSVAFSTVSGNAYLKVDGKLILESHARQSTSPTPVYLLTNDYAIHLNPVNPGTCCKLYSCRIYDSSSTLVRDFVPARREADGEVGMYDFVTGRFFANEGTGSFEAPAESASLKDYTVLDKITFDGEHSISLPEHVTGTFEVDAKSYDGKKVYPVYRGGYCLGLTTHPYYAGVYDLYELTSRCGNTVLHHYIPVMHKKTGEIGVFDTVENIFCPLRATFDNALSQIFFADPTVYSPAIAELAALAEANEPKYRALVEEQSFSMIAEYTGTDGKETDFIHHSPYTLYKKDFIKDGEIYHLYLLSVRGTLDEDEWTSNFTMGNQRSGFHEGFEKGANFITANISGDIKNDPAHNKIVITGFSRGAAVASILAAKYMEQGTKFAKDSVFAYALGCPNYSTRSQRYDNIFHICNAGDMVTHIPLTAWGFGKEGIVITLPNDKETMSLLDAKLRRYQTDNGLDVVGYGGFAEDISSEVNQLAVYVPTQTARNPNNVEKTVYLFNVFYGNAPLNASDMSELLFQLRFDGNISAVRSLVQFFISSQIKNGPSHDSATYLCWIEIMNAQ